MPFSSSSFSITIRKGLHTSARLFAQEVGLSVTKKQQFDAEEIVKSTKLVALHARISLSKKFPLTTLARALNGRTSPLATKFLDNGGLEQFGKAYLDAVVSEIIMFTYVRLPLSVVREAVWAYIGDDALSDIGNNWGVQRETPSTSKKSPYHGIKQTELPGAYGILKYSHQVIRRVNGLSEYADVDGAVYQRYSEAMSGFVRSVVAGVYLHDGEPAARKFVHDHILSRKVDVSSLFKIDQPTRELSRLCEREKLQPPVSRMIAESGRLSRSPVFVVGVYSGSNVLGSGEGGSIKEAEIKAAINALKGWYLYSPPVSRLPSEVVAGSSVDESSLYVDPGEIIV
ncbi:60S ribosomal protein L3 [Lipomyces arxii]|uniref:mitochondrial 54S ribosomal protein mL44 n=1 Tax=Lipomyces arxii TaxID=56418 RepID=UPI0034CF9AEE